jgi:putative ABC transport system permease protein
MWSASVLPKSPIERRLVATEVATPLTGPHAPRMIRLFKKLIHGHIRRHRLEALLCVIGVALGVAVVVAIDAAVNACVQSFSGAVDSLAERSTHSIFAETGLVTDEQYIALLKQKLTVPLAPMIDRGVLAASPNHDPILARLIGVDVFSERALRSFTQMQSSLDTKTFNQFLTEPGQVVLVAALADSLHVTTGSTITLTVDNKRIDVHVVGVVSPTGVAASQLSDVMIADLATAQELTGALGKLDRIDTVLKSDRDANDLTAALPAGLVLRSTQQQSQSLAQLIGSYRLNLGALSLMASFVAVFIVYNAMLISVQQRAVSLGILRCLGASQWQLGGIYFSESILFAVVGGVLGVVGGWGLSRILVGYIGTTINDLYAAVRPLPVQLDAAMWAKGLGVSLGSCLIGALVPLLRAARTPPVTAFRGSERQRSATKKSALLAGAGALLVALAYVAWLAPGDSPIAGFVMALLIAMGFALVCPWITQLACAVIAKTGRLFQLIWLQMSAATVSRSLGITSVAVAATMLSMSMNIGIRTMVSSFRSSLDSWMGRRFAADIFVAPELLVNHKIDATLDPKVEQWVARQPQIAHINEYRNIDVLIGGKPTLLAGTDVVEVLKTLPMKKLARTDATFNPGTDALISEPLAGRLHMSAGAALTVDSPTGPHTFHVFGIFYDFGTERGQIMLARPTFAADWRDDRINSLQVSLKPGADRQMLARQWAQALRPSYPVVIDSFSDVKTQAMTVFDRTFRVTVVLTWLSGAVAFCGLAGSLLALALARQRDFGVLTALGMSSRQLAGWVLGQSVLIAAASAMVAPVAGTLLAYVLAYVIQYRSFGWSIPTTPQPQFWLQNLWLALAAALVAAIYPVYRLRSSPLAARLQRD